MPTGWAGISSPGSRLSCRQRHEEEEVVGQGTNGGWEFEEGGAVRADVRSQSQEAMGLPLGHCNGREGNDG